MGPSATYTLNICKYQFNPSLSSHWQEISFIYGFGYGQLSFADGKFFALGNSDYNGLHLYFAKVEFGSISVNWRSKMYCPFTSWEVGLSEPLLSSDYSKIYSLFIYRPTNSLYLYYVELNATTGDASGSRYKSNIVLNSVYGSAIHENYIIATIQTSSYYLVIFNIVTSVFKFYSFSGNIYGCSVETSSGR